MRMIKDLTQHQRILMTMCRNKDKQWFLPQDFMKPDLGDLFVGYEASARLSELASENPRMIESKREGKYIKRRLCLESLQSWLPDLPKDLRYVFHRTGLTKDIAREPAEPQDRTIKIKAVYQGNAYGDTNYRRGETYDLVIDSLELGKPLTILHPHERSYLETKNFSKDWKVL